MNMVLGAGDIIYAFGVLPAMQRKTIADVRWSFILNHCPYTTSVISCGKRAGCFTCSLVTRSSTCFRTWTSRTLSSVRDLPRKHSSYLQWYLK